MADDLTPAPSEPVQTASAEPASASSSPDPSSTSPQDTRSIAASVFADSEAAPADSPSAIPSTPPPTPVAATSDDEDDAGYQNLLASGSMPVDRHRAVLTNARNKTRAEVEREIRARLGWAESLDQKRVGYALDIFDSLDKNADETVRRLARVYGVDFTPPPAPKEPEGPPPPDVKLTDGQEFFSAPTTLKREQWLMSEFDKKITALEQRYKPLVEERHLAKLRDSANTEAGSTLAECRAKWPQFQPLEREIKQLMTVDPNLSLERAYIQAFAAKGLPAIQQQYQTEHASQLTRKAAASSAPPGAARPVTPLRYDQRSTRDIAAEVFAQS